MIPSTDLVASRMGLARRMAYKHRGMYRGDLDSAESTAMLGLALAAREYDPDRNKDFDRFASSVIGRLMIDEFRAEHTAKRGGNARQVPLDGMCSDHAPHSQVDAKDFADALLATLPNRDRRIVLDLISQPRGEGRRTKAVADAHRLGVRTVERLWTRASESMKAHGDAMLQGATP